MGNAYAIVISTVLVSAGFLLLLYGGVKIALHLTGISKEEPCHDD